MKRFFWRGTITMLSAALALTLLAHSARAAERMEEATVIGKDRSTQAGTVPTDTRAVQAESKMQKEAAPAGLKTDAPGVRATEKMEKPKMQEVERKKPESKSRFGHLPMWFWLLLIGGGVAAVAG